MRLRYCVPMILAAAVTPAMADLAVTYDLGTVATGSYALADTTVGKVNNAETYTSISNTTTVRHGHGEVVYQFTLTKPAYLYLKDTVEISPTGASPFPDHDYFLLNSLSTFTSNNTNPYFADKQEATSLSLVTAAFGATTAGSSQLTGVFKDSSTVNVNGLRPAGTYYLAVDARNGSVNATTGAPPATPQVDGAFEANFNVRYVDEVVAPPSTLTEINPTGQISRAYAAGETPFFSFNYTGGAFTVNTEGNTISESGGDTFLALYNSDGALVKFNDDVDFRAWSQIAVADGELPTGTYYLGFSEYKGEANPGFDFRVYPTSVGSSGQLIINGLAVVPEPASLAAVAAGLAVVGVRRRRRA